MQEFFICTTKGCINEKVTKYKCRECADRINAKQKERRLARRNKGLCFKCNSVRLKHSRFCVTHYMENLAKRFLKDKKYADLLYQKLKDQEFKCFYTGEELILGENVSIDHILPKSIYKEYQYDIDNLVFTTIEANIAKRDLSIKIFLKLCENVVKNKNNIMENLKCVKHYQQENIE